MQQGLTIQLNGTERTFDGLGSCPTIADLVSALQFRADRVALERNGEIVSRAAWSATNLLSGDRIELVHFVGGGSLSLFAA